MEVIGITGGVGAGKSAILTYLKEHTNSRIIIADQVAHDLEKQGGVCYGRIVALLGREIIADSGEIDKAKMAARIFSDRELLVKVNEIVHPAVKEYIAGEIARERAAGRLDYLFVEAALLIEDGYTEIVDEMWYIRADKTVRKDRLRTSRGYTDEKIDSIMREQLSDEEFNKYCSTVIDNSTTLECVYRQIEEKLGERLCQKQ